LKESEDQAVMSEKQDKYIHRIQEQAATKKRIWQTRDIINSFLQFIIVVGAASVPVLLLISQVPKLIPTIISGVVAIAAALSNYYKFGERSRIHRATFEALTKELDMYDFQVGPYKNLGEDQAFDLFVERTELVLDEHTKKVFALQESTQYQQIEVKNG
jgi:hypothetical protein